MSGPESGTPPEAPPPEAPPPASPPPGDAWAPAPTQTQVPGHAGLFYADVPNRIIALILDAILVGIIGFIASVIIWAIIGTPTNVTTVQDPNAVLGIRIDTSTNWLSVFVSAVVGIAISAGYYIYTWTRLRGTLGQKALGMQVGNAFDGVTLTTEQAVKRWLALGGIFALAQFLNPLPLLGLLVGLISLVWTIALLYTTATSPTKQGLHDRYANSVVVKAARSVG
jgi:hypothetical protein